eukprot:gene10287-7190_t
MPFYLFSLSMDNEKKKKERNTSSVGCAVMRCFLSSFSRCRNPSLP